MFIYKPPRVVLKTWSNDIKGKVLDMSTFTIWNCSKNVIKAGLLQQPTCWNRRRPDRPTAICDACGSPPCSSEEKVRSNIVWHTRPPTLASYTVKNWLQTWPSCLQMSPRYRSSVSRWDASTKIWSSCSPSSSLDCPRRPRGSSNINHDTWTTKFFRFRCCILELLTWSSPGPLIVDPYF